MHNSVKENENIEVKSIVKGKNVYLPAFLTAAVE